MAIGNSFRFRDAVKHDFTSTLQIRYDDEAYRLFILFWMTKQHFFQQVPHVVAETEARKDIAWYRSGDNNYNDIDETELQKDMNFNEYWSRTVHCEKFKEPMPTNGKAYWSHSRGCSSLQGCQPL